MSQRLRIDPPAAPSPRTTALSRRWLLRVGGLVGATIGLGFSGTVTAWAEGGELERRRQAVLAAGERARRRVFPGWKTANGFQAETRADAGGRIWTRPVSGTPVAVALQDGDARTLLGYVIQRFHGEVTEVTADGVVGFSTAVGRRGPRSNHASGTAVHLLPGRFPVGAEDGLFDHQVRVVRDILRGCNGQVGWGGDLQPRCEGLFYLTSGPSDAGLRKTAGVRRARETTPAGKAGAHPLGS